MTNTASSAEAFSLFEKWKEEHTFLHVHTYSLAASNRFDAVVLTVLRDTGKLVLSVRALDGEEATFHIDLKGAMFEYADPRESPDPEISAVIWDCFLLARLPSGGSLIFAVRN